MHMSRLFAAFLTCLFPVLGVAAQCTDAPDFSALQTQWSGWGNGHANTRHAEAGLDSTDLGTLELRWAFGFPGTGSVVGNPVVHGELLFIGVDTGAVYALDAASACIHWVFQADNGVRTAPALAELDGTWMLFFGDRSAQVYAVEAGTGRQLWKTAVDEHQAAILTGSPQLVHLAGETAPDRLIVPVSSSEEGIAAVPTYNCCSFRGSVVSLDARTGKLVWKALTIRSEVRATSATTQGPSGAAIWSAPTLDVPGGQLFVTTGDAYSGPADLATDAVIAMDLGTGTIRWINQGTADDIWTVVCMTPNAPDDCGPDQDYGSPGMLVEAAGRRFLVAGQKSGYVRAFDLRGGTLLWRTALVENTTEFGGKIIWGGASDGNQVYFGLGTGGIAAVAIADGALVWFTPLAPSEDRARNTGQDGPLTASADLVFSGGWDGVLRALSAESGAILWQYDTVRDYATANAVPANGGSMGAAGPVVAGKRLFVPTGYVGVKNGMRGNALLMFAP
jgi:polyvinyl alcohol dehydrogenase (cytochrome)